MTALTPPIVLVDDDIDHAVIVRTVLGTVAPDAPVETLTDARGVYARLQSAPEGALVLMDRLLSGLESIALIEPLRAERPDLRIVLMSSSLSETDAARAIEAGAIDAIEKPGSVDGWRKLLQRLVQREDADDTRETDDDGAVA